MDFTPEAEAYTNRFPALTKVVLRQGAVEFDPLMPSDDITLLSTSVALVVRPDMQPALVSLLTHAVVHNPKSGFDKNGDPVLFYRAGEFPSANDPEFEVANDARVVYKSGELPVVLKTLAPRAHSLRRAVLLYGLRQRRTPRRWWACWASLAILLPLTRAHPGALRLDHPAAAGLLVPPAQGAGAQTRQQRAQVRRRRRCRPNSTASIRHVRAHPRAALLLQPALRPARTHRSGAPTPRRAPAGHAHGGGVTGRP